MAFHDIVAIGTSAGGVAALIEVVRSLPKDLRAAVFVVIHMSPSSPSILPEILSKAGPLPAFHPEDGDKVQHGRVYVARPDRHLLVEKNRVLVKNGPKENRFRPAIDALFRSIAYTYGPRAIGVVLTGTLDDGTSGLWTIKRHGGVAVVQDPAGAHSPQMPMNVLSEMKVDHVVPLSEMGSLLTRLVEKPIGPRPKRSAKEQKRLAMEIEIATKDNAFDRGIIGIGELTAFTCPECQGALVKLKEGDITRFRCHTGHAFTASALLAGISEASEDHLWRAMQSIEGFTMLLNEIGNHFKDKGQPQEAEKFFRKAEQNRKRARVIHESVIQQESLSEDLRFEKPGDKRFRPHRKKNNR
jgi:two-component system chemotaxis response regulator CheB